MGRGVANLSRRSAALVRSIPLHFKATRCSAFQFRCIALLLCALPLLSASPLFRCIAERFAALPFHSVSMQCYSVASRLLTLPSISFPFHGKSSTGYALPLLFPSEHFLRVSVHFSTLALRRRATLHHGSAVQRLAFPLRHWISSQVNRPFPLLRH